MNTNTHDLQSKVQQIYAETKGPKGTVCNALSIYTTKWPYAGYNFKQTYFFSIPFSMVIYDKTKANVCKPISEFTTVPPLTHYTYFKICIVQ